MYDSCVTVDKFPLMRKNDLNGKAELSLDEASHFNSCYTCMAQLSVDQWLVGQMGQRFGIGHMGHWLIPMTD